MADLSQQLRDYRLTKRKEKLATVGRIAGGILDIPLQGGVSGSVRRWSPPKEQPISNREKLAYELKNAEKAQARSEKHKASIARSAKAVDASEAKIAELEAGLKGSMKLSESERGKQEYWHNLFASKRARGERLSNPDMLDMFKDLDSVEPRKFVQILNAIDPSLYKDLSGKGASKLVDGKLQEKFKIKFKEAETHEAIAEGQLEQEKETLQRASDNLHRAEVGEIRHGDGISGVDTGVDFSKSPPSASQYATVGGSSIDRIRALYDADPDNRKDSQKQYEALYNDPKMRELAEDLGLNPDNSIQMDHFIKTMTKAEKKARKLYAKARRKGWTEQEMAAELKKSNLYSDPEGLSNKHMLVEMQLSLLGVKEPKALATTLTPEEIEDVEEELTSEYEEEFDARKDAEDLAVRGATEDQAAESVAGRTAEEQAEVDAGIAGQEEENLQTQQNLAEGFNPDDFSFKPDEAALGFKTAPGLDDADDSYEWQGVPEEELSDTGRMTDDQKVQAIQNRWDQRLENETDAQPFELAQPTDPDPFALPDKDDEFNQDDFSISLDSEPVVEDGSGEAPKKNPPHGEPGHIHRKDVLHAQHLGFIGAKIQKLGKKASDYDFVYTPIGTIAAYPKGTYKGKSPIRNDQVSAAQLNSRSFSSPSDYFKDDDSPAAKPVPLSFAQGRVPALQESLNREQKMAEALAAAPEGPGQEDKAPPKTEEELEQARRARTTGIDGTPATLR